MKTKTTIRTMEITLEKSKLMFIGTSSLTIFSWCTDCHKRAQLLPPEEIAFAAPRTVYRWIENEQVYFTELPGGLVLVCSMCAERERRDCSEDIVMSSEV